MESAMRDSLIGCCGLYCGLCSKYQSKAPSRCVGCKLGEQHSWCSIWNCCVRKKGLETCAACDEVFRCEVFLRRKVAEWVPASGNLRRIGEVGIREWLADQEARRALAERLLLDYNEGRSMSFCCRSCATLPLELVRQALEEADRRFAGDRMDTSDMRLRAKVLRDLIRDKALKADIPLD